MNKALLQQALEALKSSCIYVDVEGSSDDFDSHRSAIDAITAELTKPEPSPPNKVTATSPETIYLCVSDDAEDADRDFVEYIRADLVRSH